ncbi:MAG: hypothetical protein IPH88_03660 [Bacteroidales bacterium]|nr:hypothetical protein [Bacteroidales bacterium]
MLETIVFLSIQILLNLLVRIIRHDRLSYVFASLAGLIFSVLMLSYPFWSLNIYYLFYPEKLNPSCGMLSLASMLFQWIIGLPLVILLQFLFNRFIHRISVLKLKYEVK